MRRTVVALVALLVSAFGLDIAAAQRADGSKVTGGGQIAVPEDGQGAGDTIAFYGGELPGGRETGQVQYVPTSTGGGSAEGYWHGFVDCVNIEGNTATLSGPTTDGDQFWLQIVDNGTPAEGTDVIRLKKPEDEADCDEEAENVDSSDLGRGNAVVHNG